MCKINFSRAWITTTTTNYIWTSIWLSFEKFMAFFAFFFSLITAYVRCCINVSFLLIHNRYLFSHFLSHLIFMLWILQQHFNVSFFFSSPAILCNLFVSAFEMDNAIRWWWWCRAKAHIHEFRFIWYRSFLSHIIIMFMKIHGNFFLFWCHQNYKHVRSFIFPFFMGMWDVWCVCLHLIYFFIYFDDGTRMWIHFEVMLKVSQKYKQQTTIMMMMMMYIIKLG